MTHNPEFIVLEVKVKQRTGLLLTRQPKKLENSQSVGYKNQRLALMIILWYLPSRTDSQIATTMYIVERTVETPSQTPRAERLGIPMANKAHTNPAMAIKYGSFIVWSSFQKRTKAACIANTEIFISRHSLTSGMSSSLSRVNMK